MYCPLVKNAHKLAQQFHMLTSVLHGFSLVFHRGIAFAALKNLWGCLVFNFYL